MTFGQKFKMLVVSRRERYEDYGFVAKKSTVYRWAADKASPALWQIQKLAEHFGVPVAYLADEHFNDPAQVYEPTISAEERQYVQIGRDLGMEDAALIMGVVKVIVKERSMQEVYRRLLRTEPDSGAGPGNPGPGGNPTNLKVHERGQGGAQPVPDHKPKSAGKRGVDRGDDGGVGGGGRRGQGADGRLGRQPGDEVAGVVPRDPAAPAIPAAPPRPVPCQR